LAGSTVIITGASSGIGRSAAALLASLGARLILVGRSPEKYRPVRVELDQLGASHRLVAAELGDLSSVATAAHHLADQVDNDGELILINNAATAGSRGVTRDGFELAFGVNYLAPYLLSSVVIERLGVATVINVTSNAHYSTPGLDLELAVGRTRSLSGWREYSHSKAAQAAFTIELAERNAAVRSLAVHPGVIATRLWRRIPQPFRFFVTHRMASPDAGALPLVRAATDRALLSGGYLAPEGLRIPSPAVRDVSARRRLWDASRQWVEPFL
jgi:retinol dehydrogenase-12